MEPTVDRKFFLVSCDNLPLQITLPRMVRIIQEEKVMDVKLVEAGQNPTRWRRDRPSQVYIPMRSGIESIPLGNMELWRQNVLRRKDYSLHCSASRPSEYKAHLYRLPHTSYGTIEIPFNSAQPHAGDLYR